MSSLLFLALLPVVSQMVPPGSRVPRMAKPPVVFLNGYQVLCLGIGFPDTFGTADQTMQANGQASLFFNNCNYPAPSIEALGNAFGEFLGSLRYEDGQSVDQVDVVAHSMGGLILRSYLSGKQPELGVFRPPAVTRIRKAVFLATPHFGTGVAAGLSGDPLVEELSSGSRFLLDLNTWNQGTDDLRGIDSFALIGNGGTGAATSPGFDDGLVALTSGSLAFARTGRTRLLPYCHTNGGGLISAFGLCDVTAQGIAYIRSNTQDTARAIVSFLNGTNDWQGIGVAAEQNSVLASEGGLLVTVRTSDDTTVAATSVTATAGSSSKKLNQASGDVAYTDRFAAGSGTLAAVAGSLQVNQSITLSAGTVQPVIVKQGPRIGRVLPAGSGVFPLSMAPRTAIAIYGDSLAPQTASFSGTTLPQDLGGARVLLNGSPLSLYYASPAQINAVLPENAAGLMKLTVESAAGKSSVNIVIEAAVPSIFTQNASGSGPAAALNAVTNALVTPGNPLTAGDYVSIYLTGLGSTTNRNGLDVANATVSVTVGGKDCPVAFAGRAPGYQGLDQLNCVIPAGIAAGPAPVIIRAGDRSSNTATLEIR